MKKIHPQIITVASFWLSIVIIIAMHVNTNIEFKHFYPRINTKQTNKSVLSQKICKGYYVLYSDAQSFLSTYPFVKTRVASDADFKPQA